MQVRSPLPAISNLTTATILFLPMWILPPYRIISIHPNPLEISSSSTPPVLDRNLTLLWAIAMLATGMHIPKCCQLKTYDLRRFRFPIRSPRIINRSKVIPPIIVSSKDPNKKTNSLEENNLRLYNNSNKHNNSSSNIDLNLPLSSNHHNLSILLNLTLRRTTFSLIMLRIFGRLTRLSSNNSSNQLKCLLQHLLQEIITMVRF